MAGPPMTRADDRGHPLCDHRGMRLGPGARTTALIALFAIACSKGGGSKDEAAAKSSGPAAPVAAPGDAAAPATEAKAKPQPPAPPTKAVRRDFRGRMKQGRDLEKQGKHAEAMAEFEAALKLVPNNPRALSELGWAAFKANHLTRSIEASRTAVNGETDPRVAAASLYNLGRALEAKGDRAGALAAYEESLDRRPSQTVLDRFQTLGGKLMIWARAPGCGASPVTQEALCDCFKRQGADPEEPEQEIRCELADPVDGFQLVSIGDVNSERERGFVNTYLAKRDGDQVQILASVVNGAFLGPKSYDTLTLDGARQRKVGTRTVWVVSVTHDAGDEEFMPRVGKTVTHTQIYCTDQVGSLACTKPIAVDATWTMKIGEQESADPEEVEWFRKDFGHDSPATWSYRMKTSLSDGGVLTLESVSGVKPYRITYALW